MYKTSFDLSADQATLDYSELIKTAIVAVVYSKEALARKLDKWSEEEQPTALLAERMLEDAKWLATATKTLYFLREAQTREEIKLDVHRKE